MKNIQNALLSASLMLSISLFCGCSSNTVQNLDDVNSVTVPPSQNSALQSISPSKTASDDHYEYRIIEKSTNKWIKNEWEPLTESNNTITKSSNNHKTDTGIPASDDKNQTVGDENGSSGLQYYVDKAGLYIDNKKMHEANMTKEPSHVDTISTLPGIGSKKGR